MTNHLCSLLEAAELIDSGRPLLFAGNEEALASLPPGNWIGGTICYFMDEQGGLREEAKVFATELPFGADCTIQSYGAETIHRVAAEASEGDLSFIIVPAFSRVHEAYATGAPDFEDMFLKPILGWVAGVALESIGTVSPKALNGRTGERWDDRAVVLRMPLPRGTVARIDIINLFHQGSGPAITFPVEGFQAGSCLVDGRPTTLAAYIAEHEIDTRLPLVADYGGAMINTSIAKVDASAAQVALYSPVFPGIEYRFAAPVGDYGEEFGKAMPTGIHAAFSCNCILNYLYGGLEGRQLPGPRGPMTFGEIAYQLLNQTMVYVELDQAA